MSAGHRVRFEDADESLSGEWLVALATHDVTEQGGGVGPPAGVGHQMGRIAPFPGRTTQDENEYYLALRVRR